MSGRLKLTLLGSGSSTGVPRLGGDEGPDWGACDPNEPRNNRRRCSLLVEYAQAGRAEPTVILIDTSPDCRVQLLDARVTRIDAIVYTHDHADQTHGVDDVRPLVLKHKRRIPVFMDGPTMATLTERFRYAFHGAHVYQPIFDVRPEIHPYEPFEIDGPGGAISFLPLLQDHGPVHSLGFRFGPAAYSNDVVRLPDRSLEALHGLDLWIVDALRDKPHPTHAHVGQALEWAAAIGAKRTILTNLHMDLDYRELSGRLPAGVEAGYDGLVAIADTV